MTKLISIKLVLIACILAASTVACTKVTTTQLDAATNQQNLERAFANEDSLNSDMITYSFEYVDSDDTAKPTRHDDPAVTVTVANVEGRQAYSYEPHRMPANSTGVSVGQ
ncbi:hypothetical protein GF380_04640 [Candidatus Uhrbacteria bacterium]|nr:hypothetical protein [Candidatus Uhrbacteria bacterium]MBD3284343.1 hypothetical protein [Candidatus Uhrbacteria bacterium]